MAPTRAASATPRRSARVRASKQPVVIDLTTPAPVTAPSHRITKPKPPPKSKKPARTECTTCGDNLLNRSFSKQLPTSSCTHDLSTCKNCLKAWINTQIETNTYDHLSCPECSALMQNADVKAHGSKEAYARFDELERRDIAEKTPGWRWCMSSECRAGQVHQPLLEVSPNVGRATRSKKAIKKPTLEAAGNNVCVCNECGAKACVTCDRPYHEEETCEQFQTRMNKYQKDEKATLKTIGKECKECPKCSKNIQRNGGCDHMICTQCRTAFCWRCSTTYAVINQTGHAQGCTYARQDRIDPHAPGVQVNGGGGGNMPFWFNNAANNINNAANQVNGMLHQLAGMVPPRQ